MALAQPAANTWDLDAVTTGALEVLRMENDDIDEPAVADYAAEATQLIDVELDKVPVTEPTEPFDAGAVPTLFRSAVRLTVELYQAPPSGDPLAPPDPVAVVRAAIRPWKSRWGVG